MDPEHDETGGGFGRFLDLLGGAWVWIFIGLLAVGALSVRLLVKPAKSSVDESVAATTTLATTTTTTTTTVAPTTVPPTSAIETPDVWTMPDEVGKDLASAKAEIVELSGGAVNSNVSVSDASGQGRHQIIHENWKVCSQSPEPGGKFTPESGVDFEVVKKGESCPGSADTTQTLPASGTTRTP